jgi:hypothetical protein
VSASTPPSMTAATSERHIDCSIPIERQRGDETPKNLEYHEPKIFNFDCYACNESSGGNKLRTIFHHIERSRLIRELI